MTSGLGASKKSSARREWGRSTSNSLKSIKRKDMVINDGHEINFTLDRFHS